MFGWDRFHRAAADALKPHCHDAYEICLLCEGSVIWRVGDERHCVGRGEAFFTRPDEVHGGWDDAMHPCELYWVQVALPDDGVLPGFDEDATAELRYHLNQEGPRCFPAPVEMGEAFAALRREFARLEGLLAVPLARAELHRILALTVRGRTAAVSESLPTAACSPEIQAAMVWMTERLAEPFAIQEAAAAVGLHPSRLHDRFLAEVGLTPTDWRVRQRVAAAERLLLCEATPVTEVALSLGFTSSQYFATAFKRYTGRTPSEYRAVARQRSRSVGMS